MLRQPESREIIRRGRESMSYFWPVVYENVYIFVTFIAVLVLDPRII